MGSTATSPVSQRQSEFYERPFIDEAHSSGVSWSAVFAGAFVAAALSVSLLALGTGLGLSSVSPWAGAGASASTIGMAAILWLILMQVISSSMGGYLAGRLRTKWASIHTDEVYFRDTAHGFLVWAVGLVLTASFLTAAAVSMMGGAASGNSSLLTRSNGPEANTQSVDSSAYFIDTLFRGGSATQEPNDNAVRREAGLIFANGLRQGTLSPADATYLARLVATKTGVSEPEAQRRVSEGFLQTQQAADAARKAAAHLSLWLFAALLIGAFCASLSATFGGTQRDHVKLA